MRQVLLAAALVLAAGPAFAGVGAGTDRWAASDDCARKSFELFPDFTKEHAQKRDAYVRKCLAERRQPPRAGTAPRN